MRKFILKIIIFGLPILVLSYPLDLLLSKKLATYDTLDYVEGEYSVWNDLYNNRIDSDIVVYGSSRACYHFDPEIMEVALGYSTYNLGISGHNFWLQYLRHKVLIEFNRKPKYIIISVDGYGFQKKDELYNASQFLPYMLFNWEMKDFINVYEGFKDVDFYIPLLRYQGNFSAISRAFRTPSLNHPSGKVKGFAGRKMEWNSDLANAKSKFTDYRIDLDQSLLKTFDKFLQECNMLNIEVIIVQSPEHIEGQNFVKNRIEVINAVEYYAKKHNVVFLDYSEDDICKNKSYFFNSTHLNKLGTEVFTQKLVKDLNNMNLIE